MVTPLAALVKVRLAEVPVTELVARAVGAAQLVSVVKEAVLEAEVPPAVQLLTTLTE